MKTVYDRMMENNSYQKTKDFIIKQKWPYARKKAYAEKIAWEFYQHPDVAGRCYVTVGGLDSITLFLFLRSIGINVPAVSVSSLEDKSIQLVHKALGIRSLSPIKDENGRPYTKMRVIQQYGYPVISKEAAQKISHLQNPTRKNATVRHAIMTGETGEYGGFKKNSRMKMSQKWLEKFGGPENENEGTNYQTAPFKVSDACCYYLKERPCDLYAKETKCFPYLGLMASEGGRRQKSLMWNGCNYVGKKTKRSCPFAIFSRQDLLTLALEMDAYYHAHWKEFKPITVDAETNAITYGEPIHLDTIIPAIYGEIAECGYRSEAEVRELVEANGGIMDESFSKPLLCTTLAQRTGCSICVALEYTWKNARTALTCFGREILKSGTCGCTTLSRMPPATGLAGTVFLTTSAWNGETRSSFLEVRKIDLCGCSRYHKTGSRRFQSHAALHGGQLFQSWRCLPRSR